MENNCCPLVPLLSMYLSFPSALSFCYLPTNPPSYTKEKEKKEYYRITGKTGYCNDMTESSLSLVSRSCHLSHNSFQAHSSSPFPFSVYFYLYFFPRYKLSAPFWPSFVTWYELKLYYKCTDWKPVEKRSLIPYTLLCTPAYNCMWNDGYFKTTTLCSQPCNFIHASPFYTCRASVFFSAFIFFQWFTAPSFLDRRLQLHFCANCQFTLKADDQQFPTTPFNLLTCLPQTFSLPFCFSHQQLFYSL